MKPSLALSFFEQIQRLDESERASFLHKLIADKTFETDYLEFKGCLKDGALLPNEEIRKHYGKALSAFANTGGGVLIWGVNAASDPKTGVDCAQSLALAPDARVLFSALDQIERDAANPPIQGVVKFPVLADGTRGFVVCLIPESRYKPHARRVDGKDAHYYMRVSSHSIQADHSTLRRLFFPEYHSRLELYFRSFLARGLPDAPRSFLSPLTLGQLPQMERSYLATHIYLHNAGLGTAEGITALFKSPSVTSDDIAQHWATAVSAWPGKFFGFTDDVHPHEMVAVATLATPIQVFETREAWDWSGSVPEVLVHLFAKNEPPIEVRYSFDRAHLNLNQTGIMREIEF
jgi:hypothetical protein